MYTIKLRRHPVRFYLLMLMVFSLNIVFLIVAISIAMVGCKELGNGWVIAILILSVVSVTLWYIIYCYFRDSPRMEADSGKIMFRGSEAYNWDDVAVIEFNEVQCANLMYPGPMYGMRFCFKDGTEQSLLNDMYLNLWQLKQFVQQVVVDKQSYTGYTCPAVKKEEVGDDLFQYFRGNQFTSGRGIMLWVSIPLIVVSVSHSDDLTDIIACFITFLPVLYPLFYFWSLALNFFGVSGHFVVIKNHNIFWRKKYYRIADILEAIFDPGGHLGSSLHIVTKDFKTRSFPAGTLRKRHWQALKEELERRGIVVHDHPY